MTEKLYARRDSNVEVIVPTNAAGVGIAAGTSWAWSAWAQITAGLSYPFVVCGAYFGAFVSAPAGTPNSLSTLQVQLGTGAAASEQPFASFTLSNFLANPAPNTVNVFLSRLSTLFCEPKLFPASTRFAYRGTQSGAIDLYAPSLYLFGYDASKFSLPAGAIDILRYIKGLKLDSTVTMPLAGAGTTVTAGGSTWGFGSWIEFIASASFDLLVHELNLADITGSRSVQAEIGIGAAGSEVSVAALGFPGRGVFATQVGPARLYRPTYVRRGERVAVRIKSNTASYAPAFYMMVEYLI